MIPFPPSSGGEKLTLIDWLTELYLSLLENDWKLNDIEEMDIHCYLNILSYKANKEYKKNIETVLNIL